MINRITDLIDLTQDKQIGVLESGKRQLDKVKHWRYFGDGSCHWGGELLPVLTKAKIIIKAKEWKNVTE